MGSGTTEYMTGPVLELNRHRLGLDLIVMTGSRSFKTVCTMTMSEHTCEGGSVFLSGEQDRDEVESNWNRLSSSWNACDGVPADQLEPGMVARLLAENAALKEKYAELNRAARKAGNALRELAARDEEQGRRGFAAVGLEALEEVLEIGE